jgi:hypothetical protein
MTVPGEMFLLPKTRSPGFQLLVCPTSVSFCTIVTQWPSPINAFFQEYSLSDKCAPYFLRVKKEALEQYLDTQLSLPMRDLIDFAVEFAVRVDEVTRFRSSDSNEDDRTIIIRD